MASFPVPFPPRGARAAAAVALALAALAGAPGARLGAQPPAATTAPAPAAPAPAPADVRFLQHMMAHHAQALVMTALLPERTAREDLRLLAERIAVSQRDELALMRDWLARRGAPVPAVVTTPGGAPAGGDPHAGHGAGHAGMPGMLTDVELAALAAARGAAFERLFLASMIRHHEGALTMVADYLATPGAAQDAAVFGMASDIDADQRAEIRRMRRLPGAPAATGAATPAAAPAHRH